MKVIDRIKQRWRALMENEELKRQLYVIIFESDTPAGKLFDVVLMVAIVASIFITMFDSLISVRWGTWTMVVLEYMFTAFFSIEYLARLYCSPDRRKFVFSFFGIIDLLSILPMYLGFVLHGARYLIALRSFRLIRVFRVFKLFSFLDEGYRLMDSIRMSFRKILVFFLFVLVLVISIGTILFIVEGREPDTQFTDIPTSIYWAIVTMTTVGYGDIAPVTAMGRFLSAIVMLLGYTILAVPTGIVSVEMFKEAATNAQKDAERECPNCGKRGHQEGARYCDRCGYDMDGDAEVEADEAKI